MTNTEENNRKNASVALTAAGISAVIFFAGLIIVVLDIDPSINTLGVALTLFGGMLLLGGYLFLKYYLRKIRTSGNNGGDY